eukprot:355021-Chlamydomonas_euryale.AAC.12
MNTESGRARRWKPKHAGTERWLSDNVVTHISTCACMGYSLHSQVVAALSELAIPHFFTKSIFAAGVVQEQGTATLSEHIKILVGVVAVFAVTSAARGWCFSILNNRLTMRLRWVFWRFLELHAW